MKELGDSDLQSLKRKHLNLCIWTYNGDMRVEVGGNFGEI